MPRSARIVLPGVPHHLTQRGNDRQVVFVHDADYLVYRELHTGRPLGSAEFLAKYEALLGKRLQPRPVGQPKKPQEEAVEK